METHDVITSWRGSAFALVVANGEWPPLDVVRRLLGEASMSVSCDGAAQRLAAEGLDTPITVGDGDSLPSDVKDRLGSRFVHIAEQETNDLTKAVLYLHGQGHERILVVGATGLREDHTLGNVSLLIHYFKQGIQVRMLTPYGLFLPCKDRLCLNVKVGQPVSVFRHDATQLRATGLRYALYDFSMLWQGTLNEATASEVEITGKGYFLVYLPHHGAISG
ncbi:MAG: thiamine diphosphokinase [Bacteroidaceae bacterium]|nr:thiamine diphosphokinase [Bacteroidaceae bacterium]